MSDDSEDFFANNSQTSSSTADDFESTNGGNEIGVGEDFSDPNLTSFFLDLEVSNELFCKEVELWNSKDLVGKCFQSISLAEGFYRLYSKIMGFGFRRNNQQCNTASGVITMRRWVCSREGRRMQRKTEVKNTGREPRPLTRCGCEAAMIVRYTEANGCYRITTFRSGHNHQLAQRSHVHFFRCNREITVGHAMEIRTMKEAGIKTCQVMDFMVTTHGGYKNVGFIAKDLYNFITADSEITRRLTTDAEAALAYFNAGVEADPGMFVKYSVDEENRLNKIFWADSRSRLEYANFGDVLVIDSTYKTNSFKMPLVEFVGINNHRSTVVFGSALVTDESIESYVWTFQSFLHAMDEMQPISVITDGDRAIAAALSAVMPQARHRLCSWHLMRNARVVCHDAGFLTDFRTCMLTHQSEDSFEECWDLFMKKYSKVNRQWLDELYERKKKWAEAFFKGIFFGGMTTNQRCESTNAYMNRFLNCDLSLYTFVKQYSRALARLRENVLQNDFTNHQTDTVLQTHLPSLERSAASFYTRAVFIKVRDEMTKESSYTPKMVSEVGGLKKLVLKKFGDEKEGDIVVTFCVDSLRLICDCGRFECVWWPCRHMFCALKALNIEQIPPCMLKDRWANSRLLRVPLPDKMHTANHVELRYGSLLSKAHQLCHLASKNEDNYKRIMALMDSSIVNLPTHANNSNDDSIKGVDPTQVYGPAQFIVKDPEIVKTKGSLSEKKGEKGKKRRCGWCKETGHYKSSCPELRFKTVAKETIIGGVEKEDSRENSFGEEDIFL